MSALQRETLAFKNPNKVCVIKKLDALIAKWRAWEKKVTEIQDPYNRLMQSEVYADGEENIKSHRILQEQTLVFLENNLIGHGFIGGRDGMKIDRTDLRLNIRVKHRIDDLDELRACLEYANEANAQPGTTTAEHRSAILTFKASKMDSSDKDARRELGALYAALTVKSFASGLTPAAQARAVFPAEFATTERAERADERIDALHGNFRTRLSRSPGEPSIRRVGELTQEFRSRLADVQSDNSSGTKFLELREVAEAAIAAAMAAYGNGPKTADLRDKIVKGIKPHLIPLSSLLPNKIFIGHGHSSVWREFKDFLQDNLSLPLEEFNRVPQAGSWTGERLSEMLDSACFAFLIMTGEDERDGELHARENVIHEVGLFQGKLGFKRSIILLEDGCRDFSNIGGLTGIRFPKNKISVVYEEVRRTLQREKII